MSGTYWTDQGCVRCAELDHTLDGMQGLCDRLEDEVDTLTIQLHVCRTELAAANFSRGQERERADDFERRYNAMREEHNS